MEDMALAGLGALIAMIVIAAIKHHYDKRLWTEMGESFLVKNQMPLGEVRLRELIAARRSGK
jgi:hypothetical protein